MLFLANENFPLKGVRLLRDAGLHVEAIIEIMPGANDETVLAFARQNHQIILTFDSDYGELIFKKRLPVPIGVVYFRFFPNTSIEAAEMLLKLIANKQIQLENKFTVVQRERIRQRTLYTQ